MNKWRIWDYYWHAYNLLTKAQQNPQVASWILEKYFDTDNIDLFLLQNKNNEFIDGEQFLLEVQAYLNGVPLAKILGYSFFYKLKFDYSENVFCPRCETELLVEEAIKWLQQNPTAKTACDIGVGSGAICVSVAKNIPSVRMYGNDINDDAILCTYLNAQKNGTKVALMFGSNLEPYLKNEIKINCLLCNPPYISFDETIEQSVIDNDPQNALFAKNNGLASYEEIITHANQVLQKPYIMLFEIGYQQAEQVTNLLINNGFSKSHISVIQDYQGLDRIIKVVSYIEE